MAVIEQRDQTIIEKEEVILLLQNKLKETQVTLSSNTKTIEELKKSLAEAQKYSFRAILNNRSNAHHPQTLPQPYQGGQFKNDDAASKQTFSEFLRTNDNRKQSNSPNPRMNTIGDESKLQ